MADRDQLLEQYARVLEKRDALLGILLADDVSLAERRDAAVTYSLLGDIGADLEVQAGDVRLRVETLARMLTACERYLGGDPAARASFHDDVVLELRALVEDAR